MSFLEPYTAPTGETMESMYHREIHLHPRLMALWFAPVDMRLWSRLGLHAWANWP
jgi:hypothetical protein